MANFKPDQNEYKNLTPFKMWLVNQINTWGCSNFPFLESDFDKLTNYAMMMKLMKAMNNVIANENKVEEDMTNLFNAFTELQNYINNYFDNLDVQDAINNKLDEMVLDGTLELLLRPYLDNVIDPIISQQNQHIDNIDSAVTILSNRVNSLSSASPIPVSSVDNMTDTSKIYVLTTDGYWYYYNTTSETWVRGGVYQATSLDEEDTDSINSNNFFIGLFNNDKVNTFPYRAYYNTSHVYTESQSSNYYTSEFIKVDSIKELDFKQFIPSGASVYLTNYFDADKTWLSGNNNNTFKEDIANNPNIKFVRFSIRINTYGIKLNNNLGNLSTNKFYKNNGLKSYSNEYLQQGSYRFGEYNPDNVNRLCTINPIEITEFLTNVKVAEGYKLSIQFFDESMTYLSYTNYVNSEQFSNVENAKYILINISKEDQTEEITILDEVNLQITEYIQVTNNILLNDFANQYNNKKMNALGDSITYGLGLSIETPKWPDYVKNRLSLSTVRNYGISASTIANLPDHDPMCIRYADMDNDADLIVVLASRNDYVNGIPLGIKGNEDNTTFYGALKQLLDGLWEKYPTKKIVFCTMYKARKRITNETNELDSVWTNSVGLVQEDYNNAIKDMCKDYAIPVIDLYNEGTFNCWNLLAKDVWFNDTVHPSAIGQEMLGNTISNIVTSK